MEMLEGEKKKEKEKASVWLPDYMLHMALQPLLWTLADESSLLCLRTLPRLHWVYSGWCTFFFSSTAKPAIFCSFSMPSLLPASTTPTLTPAAHWSMPSLKCCVQSSPQLMLRVSCCTLVERKYPPFHVCEVFFFLSARSQLLWSAYCSENTSKELFWSALLLQFWSHVSVCSLDPCDKILIYKQSVINKHHVKQEAWQDESSVTLRCCFQEKSLRVCVCVGWVSDRNGEGTPVVLTPFSSSLVPWAAGVSAFLLWVIIWSREGWPHCQMVEERRGFTWSGIRAN